MKFMGKVLCTAAAVSLLFSGAAGCGSKKASTDANWPTGSVQLIVPAKAGGGTDAAARVFATSIQKAIGKPVVVVNQDAGGGTVASENVRTAKPDGNTLLFYHTTMLVNSNTGLYDKSAINDFTLFNVLPAGGSYSIAVGANSPYKTLKDLVAAAKEKPGKVSLGVQTNGSTHFMAGLLAKDAGVEFKIVEAGSDADKLVTLQGGNIDAAFINTSGAKQYVDTGKLRFLGTISGNPNRDSFVNDVPSVAELGYKSVVFGMDFMVLGPKGVSAGVAEKINQAFVTAAKDKDVIDQLTKLKMPVESMSLKDSEARLKEMDGKISSIAKALNMGKK